MGGIREHVTPTMARTVRHAQRLVDRARFPLRPPVADFVTPREWTHWLVYAALDHGNPNALAQVEAYMGTAPPITRHRGPSTDADDPTAGDATARDAMATDTLRVLLNDAHVLQQRGATLRRRILGCFLGRLPDGRRCIEHLFTAGRPPCFRALSHASGNGAVCVWTSARTMLVEMSVSCGVRHGNASTTFVVSSCLVPVANALYLHAAWQRDARRAIGRDLASGTRLRDYINQLPTPFLMSLGVVLNRSHRLLETLLSLHYLLL